MLTRKQSEDKLAEELYSLNFLTGIKLSCCGNQMKIQILRDLLMVAQQLNNTQIYCVFPRAKEKVRNLRLNDSTQIEIILRIIQVQGVLFQKDKKNTSSKN